jgi:hypothetical protein
VAGTDRVLEDESAPTSERLDVNDALHFGRDEVPAVATVINDLRIRQRAGPADMTGCW